MKSVVQLIEVIMKIAIAVITLVSLIGGNIIYKLLFDAVPWITIAERSFFETVAIASYTTIQWMYE